MVCTLNKCRFIYVLVAVRFQKLHKLGQAGFFGFAEIVLDMTSEIGLAAVSYTHLTLPTIA